MLLCEKGKGKRNLYYIININIVHLLLSDDLICLVRWAIYKFLNRFLSKIIILSFQFPLLLGIGLMKRKLANSTYPTVEFTKDENDNFIFKSHTIIKTSETRFRLGEEFDEDRLDGKRVKVKLQINVLLFPNLLYFVCFLFIVNGYSGRQ